MAKDGESEGLFEEALQTIVLENILPCLLQVRGRIPSFLTFLGRHSSVETVLSLR